MIKIIKNEENINKGNMELDFFAKEIYLKTKSNDYGWFISDKFILPFTIFNVSFFKRLVFTTATIQKKASSIEEEKDFLNEVMFFIKENKICDFIDKPQPSAVFRTYPDSSNPIRWGTYELEIDPDINIMINKMSKSQIRYTKKALKDGLIIEKSTNIKEIFEICNNTLKRQKIPLLLNLNEFKKQHNIFSPNNIVMFKATYDNEIQGAIIIFFDKTTAYYEFGGSINRPRKGSLKSMHLKAMEYLNKEYGIKKYDFIGAVPDIIEGSKESGIQKFKKEFGSELIEGYQFNMIIRPIKYYIYYYLLKTKLKLKGITYEDSIERNKKLSKTRLKVKKQTY